MYKAMNQSRHDATGQSKGHVGRESPCPTPEGPYKRNAKGENDDGIQKGRHQAQINKGIGDEQLTRPVRNSTGLSP